MDAVWNVFCHIFDGVLICAAQHMVRRTVSSKATRFHLLRLTAQFLYDGCAVCNSNNTKRGVHEWTRFFICVREAVVPLSSELRSSGVSDGNCRRCDNRLCANFWEFALA